MIMVKSLRTLATVAVALVASATSFAQDLADKLQASYSGSLKVVVDGNSNEPSEETVYISKTAANTIKFNLNNFRLAAGTEDEMAVGNIEITDITLTGTEDNIIIKKNQNIMITEGTLEGVDVWAGPLISLAYIEQGGIPVEIDGVEKNGVLTLNIAIPLADQSVNVVFTSTQSTAVNSVESNASASEYYSVNGVKSNTLQKGINIVKMSDGSVKKVVR